MRLVRVSFLLAALLAGCQSYEGDETSPYYTVPSGSRLTLNRELTFAPGQVSLHLQEGESLRMPEVQKYNPFCKFELYRRVDAARSVSPDDMTITGTSSYQTDGAFAQAQPLLYARASFGMTAQMGDHGSEGGPPLRSSIVRMGLRSERQPDIYRLTCARWYYEGMEYGITIADIRRALGPLFTLRLPAQR